MRPHRPTSPAEQIAKGEMHWFIGYAAAAPEEMVALSQTEKLKLVFRKEDVREVRRYGERFLVHVHGGANMLVSFEQVIKAAPTCGCGEDNNEVSKQKAKAKADVVIGNYGDCSIRVECYTVNVPLSRSHARMRSHRLLVYSRNQWRGELDPTRAVIQTAAHRLPLFATGLGALVRSARNSAYVDDAFLSICFYRGCRPRRQLKHRRRLTLTQSCQENNAPVRKFERIMVFHRFVLIHLSEDCCRVT